MRAVYREYGDSYINGYADALADMRRWQQTRRQQEWERQARRWYFLKQRALGAVLLAVTVLAVWILEGDATIVNEYYFRTEERRAGNGNI